MKVRIQHIMFLAIWALMAMSLVVLAGCKDHH